MCDMEPEKGKGRERRSRRIKKEEKEVAGSNLDSCLCPRKGSLGPLSDVCL